ncbi:hypothetical protein FPANT_1959 [Fusarium pseudoanthophilum]|uniref:Uncharacterized protein n=1 Tax=Fusarium pseudoanthophilum TaxID=48495 RepID=A0A8H5PQ08_9HYPO|nr:hypothetical protein FPANT_1959 [Fusarium pseudoanthophilum]
MISFKYHALYWVLSLLTVPLTSIRKLLFGHELFMGSIDEVEFATVCLSLYCVARPVLNRFHNLHREVEVGVTKCSGLVEAADLEKPVEEISITKEPESRNGNAKGPKTKKGRKKPAKGANVMGTLEPIRQNYWPWWPAIWFADSLSGLDIFIRVWLLVPLIDVAETVLYAISSRTRPEWYKRRLELMERPL